MPGTGLAPRMLFGITDRRLLLWAARRPRGSRWMPGALLAAIPLELIQAAGLRPGGRHRSILQLSLAGRAGLPVAVPAREAERLAGLPGQ